MDEIHRRSLESAGKPWSAGKKLKNQARIWLIVLIIVWVAGLYVPYYLLQKTGSGAGVFFYPPMIWLIVKLWLDYREI